LARKKKKKEMIEKLNKFLGKKERDKMLKKMERNKKASEKRKEKSLLRDFEKWRTSGSRTY